MSKIDKASDPKAYATRPETNCHGGQTGALYWVSQNNSKGHSKNNAANYPANDTACGLFLFRCDSVGDVLNSECFPFHDIGDDFFLDLCADLKMRLGECPVKNLLRLLPWERKKLLAGLIGYFEGCKII